MLFVRLVRALFAFGLIFASYMVQLGLRRLFGKRLTEGRGLDLWELPPWLKERRKRVDAKNAKRLLAAILRLRGVYIKLGQVLSIMGGFLPRVYAKECERLQDQVPPHPFSDLRKVFRASFGKEPEELFASIDETPLAAASLGQVHVARLHDGRKVAVKFLYPNIRGVIRVDMRVLRLAVRVYRWFVPVAKLERVHESLVDLLRRETDYEHEGRCMERMAKDFAGQEGIVFPEVVWDRTTKDVLTMTFMEGFKISRTDELDKRGIERTAVATRLVQSFYKMLFVDRFFHADPHPGNFLVRDKGEGKFDIVVLDFGAICEVRGELIDGMLEILQGFFGQRDDLVVKGFLRMGFVTEGGNQELVQRTVKTYFGKLLKLQDRTASGLIKARPDELMQLADPEVERGELQELMRSFEYPEDWFYVERACVLMFWLSAQIDPALDTLQVGMPYVMPLLVQRTLAEQAAEAGQLAS
jgi:ubiquinone biosynthesis protein